MAVALNGFQGVLKHAHFLAQTLGFIIKTNEHFTRIDAQRSSVDIVNFLFHRTYLATQIQGRRNSIFEASKCKNT